MESRNSSSDNEGEYNDQDFMDHLDLEADKNRIVEHSPKGRFIRFNEELGSGAYKIVYKGYDNETGCEIAWNIIKLPKLPPKERKRISDEIALLKKLKHPNIISFISAWINKQKEEIVFITEVVTGGSLKKYLKKIKSPRLKVIKSWCREILQGIEYLHELKPHPIIHRDIKCDNIFINSNKGEIRIGDLGLATLMSNAYAASVLGTPEFMAPEMYDEVYGPSVDIYSFGMSLIEMVTNETPYRECMNPAQIYKKVINGVKPASLGLIANEEVRGFICECLKPRDERLSAKDLLNHRFLQSTDQETDNQPVALTESHEDKINEREVPSFIPTEVHFPKEMDHELDQENEKEDEKETSLNNNVQAAAKAPENMNIKGLADESSALQKRKSSDCANAEEKKNESYMTSKFKSFDHVATILNSQKTTEREYQEDIKHDSPQEKTDLSYQSKQAQQASVKKEQAKYSFHSKGVINGNLVILIKIDMQGRQIEQTVEIRRDKISYDKVTSKLQKQLSPLHINNDADFRNQVKALLESIDYLNISTFMNSGQPLNSATSIQIKSPSNGNMEAHSNEKSTNTAFQAQLFALCYDKYLTQLMRDNLWNETEESMALRQQGELLELQNKHLMQKRALWDKRHNVLSNSTLAIQSQTIETDDAQHRMHQIYDSHFKEAKMKELGQNNFLFSPLSSGPLSPTTSDNLGSANISVEIMAALLRKLAADDQNKSTSHHPDNFSENEKITRSNLASPNNQDILNKAAIEKGGSVFKFPAQFTTNASTTPQISHRTNDLVTAAINSKISPKTQLVHSSVTSPKDLPQIICSPKGFKNLTYIPQDNKTPLKSVSDKEELHQRKLENFSQIVVTKQKDEEKLLADNKKENRYGSLTINTDIIVNHAEKGQTPSQLHEKQSTKSHTEDQIKPNEPEIGLPQKAVSDPQTDNKTVKIEDPPSEVKRTHSVPKPVSVGTCNSVLKQVVCKDQTGSSYGHIISGPSVLAKNSPINSNLSHQTRQTNLSNLNKEVSVNGPLQKAEEKAQPACPPQQNFSTPKSLASLANIGKCSSASTSTKGPENIKTMNISHNNEVSGLFMNKDEQAHLKEEHSAKKIGACGLKRQPTYEVLKSIRTYKMPQTLGKHVIENNSEDIRILQLCLELLTGQEINSCGQFTLYLENQVKTYQEKAGLIADGIVTPNVWEKMIGSLEKIEKKWMTKDYLKQKEIDDLTRDREDLKKKMKDKQNKEASESLNKIESKLVDLSSLL